MSKTCFPLCYRNGGMHDLTVIFPNPEKKVQWEEFFNETKSKMSKPENHVERNAFIYLYMYTHCQV